MFGSPESKGPSPEEIGVDNEQWRKDQISAYEGIIRETESRIEFYQKRIPEVAADGFTDVADHYRKMEIETKNNLSELQAAYKKLVETGKSE